MSRKLKTEWSRLKRGKTGSRFQDQYDRDQRDASGNVGRIVRVLVGVLLFPVGVILLAVPGPGLVVIGIGAVLIAREFRWAAQWLDWTEVRGRGLVRRAKRTWRRVKGPQAVRR
jgi:uncharacterized protein (TIGR02611 family)